MNKKIIILGVGNILEKDDGIGVYATEYLRLNYTFTPSIEVVNGGVEGIHLFNHFLENDIILILDTIDLDDIAGSIYAIDSNELTGYGLNVGGAHEIGVLQCLDMLEMQGYPNDFVESIVIGIVPKSIDFEINLSDELKKVFFQYVNVIIYQLKKFGIKSAENNKNIPLEKIIKDF